MKKEEYIKQIGINLKKLRTDRGLSIKDVAYRLNLSHMSIINFETGKTDISVSRLKQLSDVYGIHVSEIFAENSPISAKIEQIRDEMREYQKKHEKAQEKIIELQGKLTNHDRNSKYQP